MSTELEDFKDRLAVALREHAAQLPAPPVRSRPRSRRPLVAAVAVAAAALAVVLLAPARNPAPASAAEFLRSAANAAERSSQPALAPGQYLYVRWNTLDGVQERWIAADGSGRARGQGEDQRLRPQPFVVGQTRVSAARLRALGRDPAALRRLVADEAERAVRTYRDFDPAQMRAFTAYSVLRDLLATPAPAGFRAAAYRQLAASPGLRIVRPGTVAVRVGDVELRCTVDPATGDVKMLERQLLRRSRQFPGPPRVMDRAVVVQRAVVGSTSARR